MWRLLAACVVAAAITPTAWACWTVIEPRAFAEECPIIVAGEIVEVAQGAPGGQRSDDTAKIRVAAIHRNELTDVALKVGDTFAVKMMSRNNSTRTSTDINYPAKTKAVWLVKLTTKGEFRIDVHPVQKQPFQLEPTLGVLPRQAKELKRGDAPPSKHANPLGTKTKDEWITRMKLLEERRAKQRQAHDAQHKAIRDLARAFADADTLDNKLWKRFADSEPDVRRGILQLTIHEQPMSGPRFAEVAQEALLREKDDNIRTHAVSQLAYCRDPGAKGMEVLASALGDKSARVRLFACQSVKFRRYEQLANEVKQLQNDPDREVREMATDTLEYWRKKTPG